MTEGIDERWLKATASPKRASAKKILTGLIALYIVAVIFGIGFMHGSMLAGICR